MNLEASNQEFYDAVCDIAVRGVSNLQSPYAMYMLPSSKQDSIHHPSKLCTREEDLQNSPLKQKEHPNVTAKDLESRAYRAGHAVERNFHKFLSCFVTVCREHNLKQHYHSMSWLENFWSTLYCINTRLLGVSQENRVCVADRVRITEWIRKLTQMPGYDLKSVRTRNEYAQLLRIMVHRGIVHGIFVRPPPTCPLPPLAECLGNEINRLVPNLPRNGPVAPIMMHTSPDGCAYVAAKRVPGGGVLCYMAVTPDAL